MNSKLFDDDQHRSTEQLHRAGAGERHYGFGDDDDGIASRHCRLWALLTITGVVAAV